MEKSRRYQAIYFVYFAAFSGFVAYRNVFYQELGMDGVQMGILGSMLVASGVLAQPVWGVVADYTRSPSRVIMLAAALSGVAILTYPLAMGLPGSPFLLVAVGTVAYAATRAPIVPISNALVVSRGYNYALTRSFGSLAFGATVLTLSTVLVWTGVSVIVYVYVAGMVVLVALLRGVPEVEETVFEGSIGVQAIGLVRQPRYLLVLLAAFAMGFISFTGSAFFSVYMRAVDLGDGLTGIAWATKTVAEVVVFLLLSRLDRWHGLAVATAGLTYAGGFATLSTFSSLGPVLVANVGMGLGVAFVYFALVNLAHDCAPDGLDSTAQTLVTSVGIGAGGSIGEVVIGWTVDAVGVQAMYAYLALASLSLTLCGVFLVALNRRRRSGGG
ncbi:MFS transporter [Halomicroarcula sp. F13]|uniref:MFS transporter n=1 Tax=Haloarcula rubra TaxID=2487747 RepID=A0AAW4PWU9_9EURY|nr:MFS transporter [Halomicroarcula rubra]MBX0325656.1 MFS transporter [Halomicroarcula rubra]